MPVINFQKLTSGRLLSNGSAQIGAYGDSDAGANPQTLYTDADLTVPYVPYLSGQQISLDLDGLPIQSNGLRVNLYIGVDYSIQLFDSVGGSVWAEARQETVVPSQGPLNSLIALSGVPAGATDLGVFDGDIIPDNSDNKEAMQALETATEGATQLLSLTDELDRPVTAADLGKKYQTGEYNTGSGVGAAMYELVDVDPGFPLVNPQKTDGSDYWLKLIFDGPVPVTTCGARPNDNTSDIYLTLVDMAGAGIRTADLSGLNFYQLTGGNIEIGITSSAPGGTITCLNDVTLTVAIDDFYMGADSGITVDCNGGQVENWISIPDGVSRPKMENVRFTNAFSNTFANFIQFGAYGVEDFVFDGCSADNVDVQKSGTPGEQNGSMRLILMSGPVSANPMSHGSIRNISCNEFGNNEDSDLIHIFNLTETRNYNVQISGIRANNVGRRAVKFQANGGLINNCISWNDRAEDQLSCVSHLGNGGNISEVKAVGNSTYGIEVLGTTVADNIELNSTATDSIAVAVCAGGSPTLSNLKGGGNVRGALLARPTSDNFGTLTVSGTSGTYTQQIILAGMDTAGGSGNSFDNLILRDIGGVSSISTLNLIVVAPFGALRPGRVDLHGFTARYAGAAFSSAINIDADTININDVKNAAGTADVIKLTNASEVNAYNIKTQGGTRAIQMIDCSNTTCVNVEGGSTSVILITQSTTSNSHVINGAIAPIGATTVGTIGAPTNVQDINPIIRT